MNGKKIETETSGSDDFEFEQESGLKKFLSGKIYSGTSFNLVLNEINFSKVNYQTKNREKISPI
jgi:hypothetical protein